MASGLHDKSGQGKPWRIIQATILMKQFKSTTNEPNLPFSRSQTFSTNFIYSSTNPKSVGTFQHHCNIHSSCLNTPVSCDTLLDIYEILIGGK